jgi:hypothetical protein
MRRPRVALTIVAAGLLATSVAAWATRGEPAGAQSPGSASSTFHAPKTGYVVYWDQDEEEDYYASASGSEGQLIIPWDPNGQMCLLHDGTGRFVVGYDPTQPSQHNPGGPPHRPYKQPPIGEELVARTGAWTGTNLYVPGPYKMSARDPGEDSPAVHGVYNGQSTYTGCAVDAQHNVFADDIGTAQGSFPIPTDGRLVEWFAPSYTTSCILYGPTTGGVDGDHHVDGSGGLSQPGMMATMPDGNLLLPQAGSASGGFPGNVVEFDHSSFPRRASQCPDGVYPRRAIRDSVFVQGTGDTLPVPSGVALDPTCGCYAVSSLFGNPSIAWFDSQGKPVASRPGVPGETLDQFGHDPAGFNPFGMAIAPDGTLYFVDIHIACKGSGLDGCGPQDMHGRVARVSFGPDHQPSAPQVIATGFAFPTSPTICVEHGQQVCPFPTHRTPAPTPETPAEAGEG